MRHDHAFEGAIPMPETIAAEHPSVFALVVSDDSLLGWGIHSGDHVCVDPDSRIEQDSICVVDIDGAYVAGQYSFNDDGSGHVRNAEGLDVPVTGGSAELIGKVVWHIRRM